MTEADISMEKIAQFLGSVAILPAAPAAHGPQESEMYTARFDCRRICARRIHIAAKLSILSEPS